MRARVKRASRRRRKFAALVPPRGSSCGADTRRARGVFVKRSSQMRRSRSRLFALAGASAAASLGFRFGAGASAQAAPVYSFETLYNDQGQPDPQGTRPDNFHFNGGGTTITQDTIGATDGTHSMKFTQVTGATFTAAITEFIPPVLTASTTNAVSFDVTVPATGQFTGAFARIAVSMFGSE